MLKSRVIKYQRLFKYLIGLNRIQRNLPKRSIKKVGVLVAIDPSSKKFKLWHDGFTEAIKKLNSNYKVKLIYFNESASADMINSINENDFLIVKSGWRTSMDYFLRKNHKKLLLPMGLMISASNHAPGRKEQLFYDVVWYETEWYKRRAIVHSNSYHAFGIDTDVMKPCLTEEKIYDIICVGAPRSYKRLDKLKNFKGKRLLIGDLKNKDKKSDSLLEKLKHDGVIIEDFQNHQTLADRYRASKLCYIPCKLHGGGERSLLEARACGLNVKIEPDNPKLKELLTSPIWDSEYYYQQLKKGIESVST